MATVLPLNLLIVVFLRVLSYLQHFFFFSLMIFSLLPHLLSAPVLMTPHPFSFQIERRLSQLQLIDWRRVALEQLISDLSCILNWDRENMVVFKVSNTQFLHLSTRHNLPHSYDVFFENTLLKPSSLLNILGVYFSHDLSWKDHITSLSIQASKRLGVLRRLQYFFTPPQLLALYRGVVRPCLEYAPHIRGGPTTPASWKRWSLELFALSILLLSLILSNLFLPVEMLRHSLSTIAITMDTALLHSLVAYLLH